MKKILLFTTLLTLTTTAMAEESWWNSLLNTVGLGEETAKEEALPSIDGMLSSITENLGVSQEQAQGGLASLLSFAKQNISAEQFSTYAKLIPGLDSVMQYLPDVAELQEGGVAGLMDKAASMNKSLSQLNQLNKQFESLGLDTDMITDYAAQARDYLDTPAGQEAKKLFSESIFKL